MNLNLPSQQGKEICFKVQKVKLFLDVNWLMRYTFQCHFNGA